MSKHDFCRRLASVTAKQYNIKERAFSVCGPFGASSATAQYHVEQFYHAYRWGTCVETPRFNEYISACCKWAARSQAYELFHNRKAEARA